MEVTIHHLGDLKFEARARGHRVICDQPPDNGGSDSGMTPPEYLLVSLYARYRSDPHAQRFLAGVNPAVTGLILSAAVLLGGTAISSWRGWILCGVSLLLLKRFRWHPALVLAIGSVVGYAGVLP